MFCHNCGMKLENDVVFCVNCGAKVVFAGIEDDVKTEIMDRESEEASDEAGNGDAISENNYVQSMDVPGGDTQEQDAAGQDGPKTIAAAEGKIEAVEISPASMVETGTAMVVPGGMEQRRFCPNCGIANDMNDLFCRECGMFFGNAQGMATAGSYADKLRKGRRAWKRVVIGAAVLVAAVLGFVFAHRFLGGLTAGDQEADFIMYLKDNELTMARKNKYEPVVVGERVFDDADEALYDNGYEADYTPECQYDGIYIYYPQKVDDSEFDLYRRRLGNSKAEPEKIDSHVVEYHVIDSDRLVYVKDSGNRKLYLYKKGELEKIASDAWGITISAESKYILWRSDENLYVQDLNMKSDRAELASDITELYGVSDDFHTIVYGKDDNLYIMKGMEERDKIASDVYQDSVYVYDINDKLKIYYLKENSEDTLTYYDLVEDDCLEQDRRMAEPRIEDYQRVTYKDTFWGMRESVEVNDSYYEEMEEYEKKLARDNLRVTLENSTVDLQGLDIYYYDAAADESEKVMEALMKSGMVSYGRIWTETTALMYVKNLNLEMSKRPKLSEVDEADDSGLGERIMKELETCSQFLYLENGVVHEIEDFGHGGAVHYSVSANEKKHMIYINVFGGSYNELYQFNYGQDNASPELVVDEPRHINFIMGEISYINEDGDLYYGEDRIDEDVDALEIGRDGVFFYLTNADKDNVEGTLHMYKDGKSVEIADDVAIGSCVMFDDDKVAFLTDYNIKKHRGDLNVYDGKNVKKIDLDVTSIITPGQGL